MLYIILFFMYIILFSYHFIFLALYLGLFPWCKLQEEELIGLMEWTFLWFLIYSMMLFSKRVLI